MKIFEKRQFMDGGPNDRGWTVGFIKAESREEADTILNINHGFIQLIEVSEEQFEKRKKEAYNNYLMFDI